MKFSRFNAVLNALVPAERYPDTDAHYRARIAVIFLILVGSALAGLGAFYLLANPLMSRSWWLATLATAAMALTVVGLLLAVRRWNCAALAAHTILLQGFLLVLVALFMTGGVQSSPVLFVLLVVPLGAVLFSGRRGALYWTLAVLLAVGTMFLLEHMAVLQPQPWPDEVSSGGALLRVWLYVLAIAVGSALINQNLNQRLRLELERERQRLDLLSRQDPLTGLANRRMFQEALQQAIARSRRQGHTVLLAYIDLNDFKPINDQHGHHVGDLVLQELADRLRRSMRSSDVIARLGGDEFAIIVEGVARDSVQPLFSQLAQRLREGMTIGDHQLSLTASIGITEYRYGGEDAEALMKRADQAMYEAKARGKELYWSDDLAGTA